MEPSFSVAISVLVQLLPLCLVTENLSNVDPGQLVALSSLGFSSFSIVLASTRVIDSTYLSLVLSLAGVTIFFLSVLEGNFSTSLQGFLSFFRDLLTLMRSLFC